MIKPVQWTPEMVSQFWDSLAEASLLSRFSFARAASPSVFRLVEPYLDRDADYIDYGGGDGFLCQYLIEHGYRCGIYEPSKAGVRNFTERLGSNHLFLGTFTSLEGKTFDGVFCLEVIEHVLEGHLDGFLASLAKIVKPSGFVLITCPNEEDLELNGVICPKCHSHFHRWQHVRSVSLDDLLELLARANLRREWVGLIGFEAAEAIEKWCFSRDRSAELAKQGRKPRLKERIKNFLRKDDAKVSEKTADLVVGSEGNIVLVAKKAC